MASPIGGAFIRVSPVFPGFQSKAKAEAGKLEQTFGRSGGCLLYTSDAADE